MSNWKRWPDDTLNQLFADTEHPDRILYPNLRDGSNLVLAADYSGEHALPEFRVLSFLLTTNDSIARWEPQRLALGKRHLDDGRRMSFKALSDALRIAAFSGFLATASQLNGVLLCVGVEKGFSLPLKNTFLQQHDWSPDTLNKLVEICVFGRLMVDALRGPGQNVFWVTDDDSTVSTENVRDDASTLMRRLLRNYPNEYPELALGIASQFDDNRRAEDLVAIPDLAAGAFSETLTAMGKKNLTESRIGANGTPYIVQIKTNLINAWRNDNSKPLKHMNVIIRRSANGKMHLPFGSPFSRLCKTDESHVGAPPIDRKWRRALEVDFIASGIDRTLDRNVVFSQRRYPS